MATSALRWFKAALVAQIALVAYWLALEVVDAFPWNDLRARSWDDGMRYEIAVNVFQLLGYMALFATGVWLLALLSVVGYTGYLGLQLWTWWRPYFQGATAEWQQEYTENYALTLKLVPAEMPYPAPDAQHIVLQALTAVVLIIAVVALAKMRELR
jgi:hypothetical protein